VSAFDGVLIAYFILYRKNFNRIIYPQKMAPAKSTDPKDLLKGGVLQCLEAITLGLPFEVWKTHMGTYRTETTVSAFRTIYRSGGMTAFWKGWEPKMVESFLKGGVLLFSKDAIIRSSKAVGMGDVSSGLIGGFGGGVAQVTIMGPCTYLVTAAVTGDKSIPLLQHVRNTWATKGIQGFYAGGIALMFRQGTNWASRQGLTDMVRGIIKSNKSKEDGGNDAKLSVMEETVSGIIGGALSTWNQPFEVMRIDAQARAAKNLPSRGAIETLKVIVKENGTERSGYIRVWCLVWVSASGRRCAWSPSHISSRSMDSKVTSGVSVLARVFMIM
jgi:hypothetical protein